MFIVCIQVYIWTHDLSEARARGVKFKNEIKMNSQHFHTITLYFWHLEITPSCISMRFWHGHKWTCRNKILKVFSAINLTYGIKYEMARGFKSKIKN